MLDLGPVHPVRLRAADPCEFIHLDIERLGRLDCAGHSITGEGGVARPSLAGGSAGPSSPIGPR